MTVRAPLEISPDSLETVEIELPDGVALTSVAHPGTLPPERCAACRFWHETVIADGVIDSVCRRYPPTPMIITRGSGNARVTAWPRPEPHHWCGEFEWPINADGEIVVRDDVIAMPDETRGR